MQSISQMSLLKNSNINTATVIYRLEDEITSWNLQFTTGLDHAACWNHWQLACFHVGGPLIAHQGYLIAGLYPPPL